MSEPIVEFKVVECQETAKSPDAIVTLPILGAATELLLDCAATGGVGVLSGPSGSGKSVCLKRLVARYPSLGLPGEAFYYCCQTSVGTTNGIKSLLADLGVGGAIVTHGRGAPMPLILKIALREFIKKNIQCILFDETDRWNESAIAGVFALHDYLKEVGHPISLVMVTNQENPAWLSDADPIRSRTLRVIRTEHVPVDEMVGLMAVWADEFEIFAAKLDGGDRTADEIARHIHDSTGGDLRRANFFVRIYLRHFAGKSVTMKLAEATLKRMDQ